MLSLEIYGGFVLDFDKEKSLGRVRKFWQVTTDYSEADYRSLEHKVYELIRRPREAFNRRAHQYRFKSNFIFSFPRIFRRFWYHFHDIFSSRLILHRPNCFSSPVFCLLHLDGGTLVVVSLPRQYSNPTNFDKTLRRNQNMIQKPSREHVVV